MAILSKETASEQVEAPGYKGSLGDLEGWTVGFEEYSAHTDLAPFFKGLPDDACQAVHLGYVIRGKVVFHYTDGATDEIEAGHAYVTKPGHTPELFPDSEVVEFTRADELAATLEVVQRNMAALEA